MEEVDITHTCLADMHGALVVLLPLSLIVIIFGDILGFISILARARSLLLLTGVLLLFGGEGTLFYLYYTGTLITLAGISVYVAYSAAAFQEALSAMRSNTVKDVDIRFGWSVALAWASFISELSVGCALLLASRAVRLQGGQEQEL
ncbi:hypothetical protein JZ751_028391 [Albula glossodonta]|uniref:Transmembrane protein 114 n=1 Tax=Albula glossodonta TaxID=121402 RepID=A0A8T2NB01_9TELE|nr:hypothetical protein JZ751_028391 [Albula glossodonta]